MLFLSAVELLSEDDLRQYLAVARAMSLKTMLLEHTDQTFRRILYVTAGLVNRTSSFATNHSVDQRVTQHLDSAATYLDTHASLPANHLAKAINTEHAINTLQDKDTLRHEMLVLMAEWSGMNVHGQIDPRLLSHHVLTTCAEYYKIDTRAVPDDMLEQRIAAAYIDESIQVLRRHIINKDIDEAAFEEQLDQLFRNMAKGDAETIRAALKLDELTSKTLLTGIKSGAITGSMIAAAGSTGFGAFMALSTAINAMTLLFGVSAPFAVYSGASVALGAALSPAGLIGIPLLVIGVLLFKGARRQHKVLLAGMVAQLLCRLQYPANLETAMML